MRYYSAKGNKEKLPSVVILLYPDSIILGKISQRKKIQQYGLTYIWDPKTKTKPTNQTNTNSKRDETGYWRQLDRGRENWRKVVKGKNFQL